MSDTQRESAGERAAWNAGRGSGVEVRWEEHAEDRTRVDEDVRKWNMTRMIEPGEDERGDVDRVAQLDMAEARAHTRNRS